MSVTLRVDRTLLPFTGGQSSIEVEGRSTGECLENLRARFPELSRIFDGTTGKLWSDISIYLNRNSVDSDQPVRDGDELTIVVGIAGG